VTITATANGNAQQASLLVGAAELSAISVTPSSVVNGGSFTGTVTLTSPASTNMVISITASDGEVTLPSQVTVPAGAASVTFQIATNLQVNSAVNETISATHGAVVRQTTVTVLPPALNTFAVVPGTFVGGTVPLAGTATLTGTAPGSWQLPVTSTNTTVVPPPAAIVIPVGSSTGQATVLTRPVLTATSVTVSASDPNGVTKSTALTVQPAAVTLSTLTLSASSVVAPGTVTGTVTLTAVAPAGGIDVDLAVPSPASAPPFVRIPAGVKTATFTVSTTICGGCTTSTSVSATHSATTKTVPLTVTQPASKSGAFIVSLTLGSAVVNGGSTATGTITLNIAATGGGAVVSLASSNTSAATVPSKVTVPKGATSATFTITALNVATAASVTITATGTNNAQHASLTVAPPNVPTLASLAIQAGSWSNNTVFAYGFVGTITLTGPAPAGGAVITLTGSRDNILSVPWNPDNLTPPPNSVTVPAGQTSVLALMSQTPFLGTQRGTIVTASYNGITLSQTVWVQAQSANFAREESVQCASLALGPCLTAMTRVPLNTGDTSGYNLYTPELQLLAETAISASLAKSIAYSYLWFGSQPVASVQTSTNTIRWYATDHLGTPFLQTDATGAVVWRAEQTPYGDIFNYRTGPTLHQPLRLPGQVAQDGTDAYYNVFRWYREGWGRYTQPDPLLGKDPNANDVFGYAKENPLSYTDPSGLLAEAICADIAVAGINTPFFHCRLHVTCKNCNGGNYGGPFDLTVGLERNRKTGALEINESPSYSGTRFDLGISEEDSCNFGKCVRSNAAFFKQFAKGWSTQYSLTGPNSNTFAGHLARTCGATSKQPYWAPGWNEPPFFKY
jgi:RHS repeat-associated protein